MLPYRRTTRAPGVPFSSRSSRFSRLVCTPSTSSAPRVRTCIFRCRAGMMIRKAVWEVPGLWTKKCDLNHCVRAAVGRPGANCRSRPRCRGRSLVREFGAIDRTGDH